MAPAVMPFTNHSDRNTRAARSRETPAWPSFSASASIQISRTATDSVGWEQGATIDERVQARVEARLRVLSRPRADRGATDLTEEEDQGLGPLGKDERPDDGAEAAASGDSRGVATARLVDVRARWGIVMGCPLLRSLAPPGPRPKRRARVEPGCPRYGRSFGSAAGRSWCCWPCRWCSASSWPPSSSWRFGRR